jgi:tRNA A-37 threonylcarbamoyl transferase component Bud32
MTVPFANPELGYREHLARALQPGLRLGRLIGRGGFAEVYAAWDEQLKRDVAVKVLRYDLAHHEALVARFRREAEAVAQLRHPNIVPIYGIGEGEGLVYFTMPLVDGETLAHRLERDPMPPVAEVRRILVDVADALQAAHRAGIVHRDIKPENIMLEGEEARVLVMDFGIAKAAATEDGALTAAGMVVGTPQYMSPEQGSGEAVVDHRSDIYSLGVVAYQMVTGRVPFAGGSVVGVLIRKATEPPPPIADLRPDCPIALAAAITRCLEKDPASRWQSAADLRDAVRAAADATGGLPEPLEAAQPGVLAGARLAGRARLVRSCTRGVGCSAGPGAGGGGGRAAPGDRAHGETGDRREHGYPWCQGGSGPERIWRLWRTRAPGARAPNDARWAARPHAGGRAPLAG